MRDQSVSTQGAQVKEKEQERVIVHMSWLRRQLAKRRIESRQQFLNRFWEAAALISFGYQYGFMEGDGALIYSYLKHAGKTAFVRYVHGLGWLGKRTLLTPWLLLVALLLLSFKLTKKRKQHRLSKEKSVGS
jgi:hypothetical protein